MEPVKSEQRGFAMAGPLTITADEDTAPSIHIGMAGEGMYVEAFEARRIAMAPVAAADAVASVEVSDR